MPKLLANIGMMPRVLPRDQIEVACSLEDELGFSAHIGTQVLLAHRWVDGGALLVFATGTLDHFASRNGGSIAVFTNLTFLPQETEHTSPSPAGVFSFLPDSDDLIPPAADTSRTSAQEATSAFAPVDIYGRIGQQLRKTSQSVCAFSGVGVSPWEGLATPIRPVADGGQVHARNFIFLHDEPAELFSRFAWTIGPDFEILADAWAMGTDVLCTLNASGKLLVGDDQSQWPDPKSLAWHRQQFLERLR